MAPLLETGQKQDVKKKNWLESTRLYLSNTWTLIEIYFPRWPWNLFN